MKTAIEIPDDVFEEADRLARQAVTESWNAVCDDGDNDGSAEIVVVSNFGFAYGGEESRTVQVVRDVRDRWIQARRIWNQHTYHVTNVLEDGRIPAIEPDWWSALNTFRTNAQIDDGGVCKPGPD